MYMRKHSVAQKLPLIVNFHNLNNKVAIPCQVRELNYKILREEIMGTKVKFNKLIPPLGVDGHIHKSKHIRSKCTLQTVGPRMSEIVRIHAFFSVTVHFLGYFPYRITNVTQLARYIDSSLINIRRVLHRLHNITKCGKFQVFFLLSLLILLLFTTTSLIYHA